MCALPAGAGEKKAWVTLLTEYCSRSKVAEDAGRPSSIFGAVKGILFGAWLDMCLCKTPGAAKRSASYLQPPPSPPPPPAPISSTNTPHGHILCRHCGDFNKKTLPPKDILARQLPLEQHETLVPDTAFARGSALSFPVVHCIAPCRWLTRRCFHVLALMDRCACVRQCGRDKLKYKPKWVVVTTEHNESHSASLLVSSTADSKKPTAIDLATCVAHRTSGHRDGGMDRRGVGELQREKQKGRGRARGCEGARGQANAWYEGSA